MDEIYKNYINAKDYLREQLPVFTESFVRYYGEQEREYIEDKFSHCIIYPFMDPIDIDMILTELYGDIDEDFACEFLEKLGIEVEIGDFTYFSINLRNISSLMKYFNEEELIDSDIENIVSFLQTAFDDEETIIFEDIIEKHHISKWKEVFLEHEQDLENYIDMLEKIKEPYQEVQDYVDKHKELLRAIEINYNFQLIQEFAYLLSPEEQEYLQSLLEKEEITDEELEGHFNDIAGDKISLCGNIETFATDIEEQINNNMLTAGTIAELKLLRIQYFINHGINHGYDYEAYENDAECQKLIPSQETIDKITSRRNYLTALARHEYYQQSFPYQDLYQELESSGIKTNQDIAAIMETKTTCTIPAIKTATGEGYPIVLIDLYPIIGGADHIITHELNHVLGFHILEYDGKIKAKVGLDILDEHIDAENDRKREILDEVLNERISVDISKDMEENGIYILTDKEAYDAPTIAYSFYFPLIESIYQKYKSDLIESRQAESFEICDNCFGMTNIDALASVFEVAFNYVNEKYHGLECYQDLKNQERTLNNFVKASNAIMHNINTYRIGQQKIKLKK